MAKVSKVEVMIHGRDIAAERARANESAKAAWDRYVADPRKLPKVEHVRTSGTIRGHVLYVRGSGFRVELLDSADLTRTIRTVDVPTALAGEPTAMDRTVAFRDAVKLARMRTRARRKGRRILVSRVTLPKL